MEKEKKYYDHLIIDTKNQTPYFELTTRCRVARHRTVLLSVNPVNQAFTKNLKKSKLHS